MTVDELFILLQEEKPDTTVEIRVGKLRHEITKVVGVAGVFSDSPRTVVLEAEEI